MQYHTVQNGRPTRTSSIRTGSSSNAVVRVALIDVNEDSVRAVRAHVPGYPATPFALDWIALPALASQALLTDQYAVYLLSENAAVAGGLFGSGLDLLREAVRRGCKTPIIFLTDSGDVLIDRAALRFGAADCIARSKITAAKITRVMRRAAERSARKTENLAAWRP